MSESIQDLLASEVAQLNNHVITLTGKRDAIINSITAAQQALNEALSLVQEIDVTLTALSHDINDIGTAGATPVATYSINGWGWEGSGPDSSVTSAVVGQTVDLYVSVDISGAPLRDVVMQAHYDPAVASVQALMMGNLPVPADVPIAIGTIPLYHLDNFADFGVTILGEGDATLTVTLTASNLPAPLSITASLTGVPAG